MKISIAQRYGMLWALYNHPGMNKLQAYMAMQLKDKLRHLSDSSTPTEQVADLEWGEVDLETSEMKFLELTIEALFDGAKVPGYVSDYLLKVLSLITP